MARRLDRLLSLRTTTARNTPANGGLTGGVASFKIVAEGPRPAYTDAYIVALAADGLGVRGAVTGVWLPGSVIRYTDAVGATISIILNRSITWTNDTYSLRYGAPHVNRRDDESAAAYPFITSPWWWSIAVPYGDIAKRGGRDVVTGGVALDVSRVIATTIGETFRAWATKTEEYYSRQEVTVGGRTLERVNGLSTWRMRWDERIGPLSTMTELDGTVWEVMGTRRLRNRAAFMDVECQKEVER